MENQVRFRPTYQFQSKCVVWEAPKQWDSSRGTCKAISRNSDNSFSVLVGKAGSNKWLPVKAVLSESEVRLWIVRCGIKL
jgi:hypothetical protein